MTVDVYDETWDRPHQPSAEHGWQESDCYWFYDRETGVGGYQRLGLRPNAGTAQIMLLAFKEDGPRYARCDSFTRSIPIAVDNRSESGQHAGGHRVESLGGGRMRYRWHEDGSSADLEFSEPFYTPRGWPSGGGGVMRTLNAGGHLEVAGRLRGAVTIGDGRYEIDALCHRDRSWGFRDHGTVSFHRYRMSSGTVGRALSWAGITISTTDVLRDAQPGRCTGRGRAHARRVRRRLRGRRRYPRRGDAVLHGVLPDEGLHRDDLRGPHHARRRGPVAPLLRHVRHSSGPIVRR